MWLLELIFGLLIVISVLKIGHVTSASPSQGLWLAAAVPQYQLPGQECVCWHQAANIACMQAQTLVTR